MNAYRQPFIFGWRQAYIVESKAILSHSSNKCKAYMEKFR